jgi:glycosidase
MRLLPYAWIVPIVLLLVHCSPGEKKEQTMLDPNDENLLKEQVTDHKITVYQIFTRLFGNTKSENEPYGTLQENGVGKFKDINEAALNAIRDMGITHVWYTGVIEHATMTDYSKFGIKPDDADVVKGRAGSPYAIKDYYDVNPDLAEDVPNRMREFEALVQRTHAKGLKVLVDFVPNHVARQYHSDAKPAGVKDLGETDDKGKSFAPNNNFYYLPGTSFVVPREYKPLENLPHPTKDGKFDETPAKVTGNDQFTNAPGINEWFETIKLNYGVDIQNNRTNHFDPVPDTWNKMRDILLFWTGKGVDGFRCDMAEMVPVEFWGWVIPQIQAANKDIVFIAEIYNPAAYRTYIEAGKFDYLYDKVGLYDTVRAVMQGHGEANFITNNWKQTQGINSRLLRFLENHDEQRIASKFFAGDARKGIPGMTVTATLNSGPVMVYFGQEVGEPALGKEGFSGDDGRTTIFDYWGVPVFQLWVNFGFYNGVGMTEDMKALREFYVRLLKTCRETEAIRKGGLYDLQAFNVQSRTAGYDGRHLYSYLRFSGDSRVLVVVNFDTQAKEANIRIPANAFAAMGLPTEGTYRLQDLLHGQKKIDFDAAQVVDAGNATSGIPISLPPLGAYVFSLK